MVKTRTFLLSALSGILLSLPWLFPDLGGALFIALVPLLMAELLLIKEEKRINSLIFIAAFLTFLIWNIGSTWWIAYVSITGMLLIAGFNATFMASIWWLGSWVRKQFGLIPGFFSLLVFWLTFEFFQHHWTIEWPWLTLGNGLANSVKWIQWYEFTGVLGGSLWILLSNILIFLVANKMSEKSFLSAIKLAGLTLIVIGLPICVSLFLYSGYTEKGPFVDVVVLQPNIDPYTEKFSGMNVEQQFKRLDSLAGSMVSDSTDLVVAPETSLPEMWEDSLMISGNINRLFSEIFAKYPEVSVIAGAITRRKFLKDETVSETARWSSDGSYSYDCFNSALLFGSYNRVVINHKSILVSGVEKLPFRKYFSFLEKFIVNLGGTSGSLASSAKPGVLETKEQVNIGPVICFESVFGEYCTELVKKGAQVLVVITNDGWWKSSPGAWQHFGYSKIRAIETRRSIACSANTGISGFISQRGDVLKKSDLYLCEALNSPIRINSEITFYSGHGDYIGRICLFISGMIVVYLLSWMWVNRFK